MQQTYDKLKGLLNGMEGDMNAFISKGNKAAGTRSRGSLNEIKKVASELRKQIQEAKNAGK